MKALFLESRAAAQCRAYAEAEGLDQDEAVDLLNRAYENGRRFENAFQIYKGDGHTYEDQWVDLCLRGDLHKHVDINLLMIWSDTPEGKPFWLKVNRALGPR